MLVPLITDQLDCINNQIVWNNVLMLNYSIKNFLCAYTRVLRVAQLADIVDFILSILDKVKIEQFYVKFILHWNCLGLFSEIVDFF